MMPIGIQMFATITSKDHARNIQQDLQNIYFTDAYRDTILQCTDGHMVISRLLTGLLFPFLKDNLSFQMVEEATLILPEHNKLEIEKSIYHLLGIKYSDQSQDVPMMGEWNEEAIDTIIETLEPEKVGRIGKMKTRSAVLHSTLTKETAVIHASTEEEKDFSDSVLVVHEVDTDDDSKKTQIQTPVVQSFNIPVRIPSDEVIPRGFLCSICHTLFPAQDLLMNHIKIHNQKYKCQACGAAFCKMRELTEHSRSHSGHQLVKCKICDKDFTEKGLRLHTERFHKVELEASKPVKKRELREIKPAPEEKEEEVDDLEMEVEETDDHQEELGKEEEEEVQGKQNKYPQNNVYFSSSDSDTEDPNSMSDGTEKAPIKVRKSELCEPCDKYFTKKGFKLHQQKHHRQGSERRQKGERKLREVKDKEGKVVKEKEGKKSALKKMFSCMYCHKKFSHMASMKVHEKVHLGGKPHHCDMCDAKFSNKFDLFAHEKEHSAHRPHKCDMCAQTFKTPESLRFHKLIHEESLPTVCRFCSKKFKNKSQLDVHENIHTGEKTHSCSQCSQCFETATKLTRHITANHLKEKVVITSSS